MKNVVLGSFIALTAIAATACTTTTTTDTALISADWSLKTAAHGSATCPPGFDTAALYNQEVNPTTLAPIGQPFIDLFDCVAGHGTSAPLPPAVYQTWVEITNTNNTSVYAQSLSAIVDVTITDKTFSADILVDGGYFDLAWNLVGASTNAPLTCAQAGATGGVEAISTMVSGTGMAFTDRYSCEDHQGITSGLPAATYTVSVDALNSADQAVSEPTVLTNQTIRAPNKVTTIPTLMIRITGK